MASWEEEHVFIQPEEVMFRPRTPQADQLTVVLLIFDVGPSESVCVN